MNAHVLDFAAQNQEHGHSFIRLVAMTPSQQVYYVFWQRKPPRVF
jgi:hypothetical protein